MVRRQPRSTLCPYTTLFRSNMSTTGTRRKGSVYNLVCGGYKLYGSKECTNHFIDYDTFYDVVLEELKNQLGLTAEQKQTLLFELENEAFETQREKEEEMYSSGLESRIKELDHTIQRLYEDNVSGKITDERFAKLSKTYETEYNDTKAKLKLIEERKSAAIAIKDDYHRFFQLLQEITEVTKLTPELLHKFIDRIEVCQGVYEGTHKKQSIKIFYKFIGNID